MGFLQEDIQAIIDSMLDAKFPLRLEVLESTNRCCREIEVGDPDRADETANAVERLFESADEEARIALVYVKESPRSYFGAWALAASKFCEDKIAGVLILEEDRSLSDMFLDLIPDALWKADLPILFDENGMLTKCSPNSRVLKYDERLSFKDVEVMLNNDELASLGGWSKGVFPVYDIAGTPEALKYIKKLSDSMLDRTAEFTRFSSFSSFIEETLPGTKASGKKSRSSCIGETIWQCKSNNSCDRVCFI